MLKGDRVYSYYKEAMVTFLGWEDNDLGIWLAKIQTDDGEISTCHPDAFKTFSKNHFALPVFYWRSASYK